MLYIRHERALREDLKDLKAAQGDIKRLDKGQGFFVWYSRDRVKKREAF